MSLAKISQINESNVHEIHPFIGEAVQPLQRRERLNTATIKTGSTPESKSVAVEDQAQTPALSINFLTYFPINITSDAMYRESDIFSNTGQYKTLVQFTKEQLDNLIGGGQAKLIRAIASMPQYIPIDESVAELLEAANNEAVNTAASEFGTGNKKLNGHFTVKKMYVYKDSNKEGENPELVLQHFLEVIEERPVVLKVLHNGGNWESKDISESEKKLVDSAINRMISKYEIDEKTARRRLTQFVKLYTHSKVNLQTLADFYKENSTQEYRRLSEYEDELVSKFSLANIELAVEYLSLKNQNNGLTISDFLRDKDRSLSEEITQLNDRYNEFKRAKFSNGSPTKDELINFEAQSDIANLKDDILKLKHHLTVIKNARASALLPGDESDISKLCEIDLEKLEVVETYRKGVTRVISIDEFIKTSGINQVDISLTAEEVKAVEALNAIRDESIRNMETILRLYTTELAVLGRIKAAQNTKSGLVASANSGDETNNTINLFAEAIENFNKILRSLSNIDDLSQDRILEISNELARLELKLFRNRANFIGYKSRIVDYIASATAIINNTEYKVLILEDIRNAKSLAETPENFCQLVQNGPFRGIASTIDYLHGIGIISGDISLANILCTPDGNYYMIDFAAANLDKAGGIDANGNKIVTHTPPFTSPEQMELGLIDHDVSGHIRNLEDRLIADSIAKPGSSISSQEPNTDLQDIAEILANYNQQISEIGYSHRSDLYSFGMVLYMMYLRDYSSENPNNCIIKPFVGTEYFQEYNNADRVNDIPSDKRATFRMSMMPNIVYRPSTMPKEVWQFFNKALAMEQTDRFDSALEMVSALEASMKLAGQL